MNAIDYARKQYFKQKYPVSTSGIISVILTIILVMTCIYFLTLD
jgi:hypothetical protein